MEYRGGELYAGGGPVDLIYKRVLMHELVEREGLDHPMVRPCATARSAWSTRSRCKMLHKKASLAVLTDERNADDLLRRRARAVIAPRSRGPGWSRSAAP